MGLLTIIYNALNKTAKCPLQDLRACLDAALEQVDTLRERVQEKDSERKELDQKIQQIRKESQEAQKALEESLRESKRYQCSLELLSRYYWWFLLCKSCVLVQGFWLNMF